jgi:hypothetical protein
MEAVAKMAQALEVIERNGRWIRWVAGGYHFTTPELPNENWVELGAVYGVSFFIVVLFVFFVSPWLVVVAPSIFNNESRRGRRWRYKLASQLPPLLLSPLMTRGRSCGKEGGMSRRWCGWLARSGLVPAD